MEYLVKVSQALLKNVLLYNSHPCKVSEVLAEFCEIFSFEKFLIYVLPKF